jgi:hypothetical protein
VNTAWPELTLASITFDRSTFSSPGRRARAPGSRPTLAQFAQQLRDWLDGREVRDAIVLEAERMRRNRAVLLRWLVARVREEPVFRRLGWEVEEPSAPSGVADLTDGEVSEALADLAERYLIEARPYGGFGRDGPIAWMGIYPTSYGMSRSSIPTCFSRKLRLCFEPSLRSRSSTSH